MAERIKTRFLVISDTHNLAFDDAGEIPLRSPLPACDVLIHAGDLTRYGKTLADYENGLHMLRTIPAELKLVIGGNHELLLDGSDANVHAGTHGFADLHRQVLERYRDPQNGITYLVEGTHVFELRNGARLTVYASPYTPLWNPETVWNYRRHQDRYNSPAQVVHDEKTECIAEHPVPSFPNVDVVITHGPPKSIHDDPGDGKSDGGEHLLRAMKRARPLLHCFGHIHGGHGASMVTWDGHDDESHAQEISHREALTNAYPEPTLLPMTQVGEKSCFINASIFNREYKPINAPWLVDLDLHRAS